MNHSFASHNGNGVCALHTPPTTAGKCAKGFLINKIAPTANALADQKADGRDIQHRGQPDFALFDHGKHNNADGCADDAAVDG